MGTYISHLWQWAGWQILFCQPTGEHKQHLWWGRTWKKFWKKWNWMDQEGRHLEDIPGKTLKWAFSYNLRFKQDLSNVTWSYITLLGIYGFILLPGLMTLKLVQGHWCVKYINCFFFFWGGGGPVYSYKISCTICFVWLMCNCKIIYTFSTG